MRGLPRISDAEWEVMNVVWEQPEISASEVVAALEDRRDRSDRTVKTLLARLVQKGALGYDVDGKRYLYRPLVSREECRAAESRTFVERVFGGAVTPALEHFVRDADLSAEEIEELRRLLGEKAEEAR